MDQKIINTPAQDELKKQIVKLEIELQSFEAAKNSVLDDGSLDAKIISMKIQLKELINSLKKKQNTVNKRLRDEHPEIAKKLKLRADAGRPRLEVEQPELLRTITNLVTFGATADAKRRSEALGSCKTLADLHSELKSLGYTISKSATYLRLLPRNHKTTEGKKHVRTVPVRLLRAQNNFHEKHVDQYFCTATIRGIETIASILGPDQVIFISQDDKSRVPLGITAANKQAKMLMHLEYQVIFSNLYIFFEIISYIILPCTYNLSLPTRLSFPIMILL